MKKKVALIFGITGQDGSYLSEFLLKKNILYTGLKEDRLQEILIELIIFIKIPHIKKRSFILHYGDITDSLSVLD